MKNSPYFNPILFPCSHMTPCPLRVLPKHTEAAEFTHTNVMALLVSHLLKDASASLLSIQFLLTLHQPSQPLGRTVLIPSSHICSPYSFSNHANSWRKVSSSVLSKSDRKNEYSLQPFLVHTVERDHRGCFVCATDFSC